MHNKQKVFITIAVIILLAIAGLILLKDTTTNISDKNSLVDNQAPSPSPEPTITDEQIDEIIVGLDSIEDPPELSLDEQIEALENAE